MSMRILSVTSYVPAVTGGGSSIRSYNLITRLAQRHCVCLLALAAGLPWEADAIADLEARAVRVVVVPLQWCRTASNVEKLLRLTRRLPMLVQPFAGPAARLAFGSILASFRPHMVHVDLLRMAWCLAAPALTAPVVLDTHNVECQRFRSERSVRYLSPRHRAIAVWEYLRLRRFETWACKRATWVAAVTEQDTQELARMAQHDRVTHVPVGVDTTYFAALDGCPDATLIFAGSMSYAPNVDSMLHFCREILPLIGASIPDIRLLIVGRDPSQDILALGDDPCIEVTGTVPDVRPYFSRSAVCVVPVRTGGGIKQKVLEAMSMGLPVVATSFGCIGIPAAPEEHVLIRDTPEAFAEAVIMLLQSPARRRELGRAAASLVRCNYSWDRSVSLLEQVYANAIQVHGRRH